MNSQWTRLIISLTCTLGFTYASGLILYAMVGEVNRKLPDEKQIEYLFMYPGKVGKIKSEYRKYYPNGRLALLWNISAGLMFAGGVAVAWSLGFFE